MVLKPEEYEFDRPDLELIERNRAIGNHSSEESNLLLGKGKSKLPEETTESSFEKGEPSQRGDPQQDDKCLRYEEMEVVKLVLHLDLDPKIFGALFKRLAHIDDAKEDESPFFKPLGYGIFLNCWKEVAESICQRASILDCAKELAESTRKLVEKLPTLQDGALSHSNLRRRASPFRPFFDSPAPSHRHPEDGTHFLDLMEMCISYKRKEKVREEMEMRGETVERIGDGIALSAAKVKSDIARVENMLNCLNPQIVNNQEREAFQKAESDVPHLLRYYKHEIKTTTELLEKMFKEIGEDAISANWWYGELRKLNHYLLNLIEKWGSTLLEKSAESSAAKVEPQSKGVVSKRNALRKQHNSQRDDPKGLFPDLVELETILEDCVFRFPQHPSFITAVGYTPILVA